MHDLDTLAKLNAQEADRQLAAQSTGEGDFILSTFVGLHLTAVHCFKTWDDVLVAAEKTRRTLAVGERIVIASPGPGRSVERTLGEYIARKTI